MELLHVDHELLVVAKPAGQHTAPLTATETGTLLSDVLAAFPEVARLPGRKPIEPGLLHRLDRETSGLVLVARTTLAFERLLAQQEAGAIEKGYLALCAAGREPLPGAVASRFRRAGPGGSQVRVVPLAPHDPSAPPARPDRHARRVSPVVYESQLALLARGGPGASRALLRVTLSRGFQHQVRAHLAHLGWPILGDGLYGAPAPPGAPARLFLHATRLRLRHPASGQELLVESPAPAEFSAALRPG